MAKVRKFNPIWSRTQRDITKNTAPWSNPPWGL